MYEAELPILMNVGFGLITFVFAFYQIRLFLKKRNILASGCFIFQWILTSLSFERILSAILLKPTDHPMFSEEFSARIGMAGVFWAVSILLMLIGLELLNKKQRIT